MSDRRRILLFLHTREEGEDDDDDDDIINHHLRFFFAFFRRHDVLPTVQKATLAIYSFPAIISKSSINALHVFLNKVR